MLTSDNKLRKSRFVLRSRGLDCW